MKNKIDPFGSLTEEQLSTWSEIVTESMFPRNGELKLKIQKFYKNQNKRNRK